MRGQRIVAAGKIGLAAAIVALIVWRGVDLRQLAAHLRALSPGALLVCWLAYGMLLILSAWRWRTLVRAQGINTGFGRILEFYYIGLFFNNIMLGSMGGDVVKAFYLARSENNRKEAAVISVMADRLAGFISFFAIGMIGVLANIRVRELREASYSFVGLFFILFFCLCLAYAKPFMKRIPPLMTVIGRIPFQETLRRLYDALYSYRHQASAVLKALAISCVMQVAVIAIAYRIGMMLGMEELKYVQLMLLIPLIGTVLALPVTPSGWGTGEYAFCRLFGLLGIAPDRALALDLILRAMVISWGLIGGVLYALPRWRHSDTPGGKTDY